MKLRDELATEIDVILICHPEITKFNVRDRGGKYYAEVTMERLRDYSHDPYRQFLKLQMTMDATFKARGWKTRTTSGPVPAMNFTYRLNADD